MTDPTRSGEAWRDRAFLGATIVCTAVLCAVLYSSVLDAPFTFDDHGALVDNPSVRWDKIEPQKVIRTLLLPYNRRPVANLTFALNYYFHRYEVFGYHAVNVAVHFANGLLVYALALVTLRRFRRLSGQRGPGLSRDAVRVGAFFASLLFVAHPLQTQSVTYVVQRMNSLAALFYLSSLLLYIHGRDHTDHRTRVRWFVAAGVSGLLAVGSKQNAITLPVAIWFYEAFFYRDLDRAWLIRSAMRLGAPLLLGACALYYIIVWGPDFGYLRRDFGMGERLLTQPRVVMLYIGLIALPLPSRLNLMHDIETSTSLFSPPTTAIAMFALLALVAAGLRLAPQHRLWSFGVLWFFLHLVVESTILPLEMVFEHRTYLPLVGVMVAAGGAVGMLRDRTPRVAWTAAMVCVALLGVGTFLRNQDWQDNFILWADIAAKSPQMARAHGNRGQAYQ
ncbi:MAG: hypothetical protein HRU01_23895, partial [Myxococcales bacterium]|nr:hypothetical protein [Myxococcales bacterium]